MFNPPLKMKISESGRISVPREISDSFFQKMDKKLSRHVANGKLSEEEKQDLLAVYVDATVNLLEYTSCDERVNHTASRVDAVITN